MRKIYFFLIVSVLGVLLFGTAANSFATTSILSVNPVDGTSSVAINTRITVMFNEAMNSASIGSTTTSTGTFTVYGGTTTPVFIGGNIEVIGSVAKFTPTSALDAGTAYNYVMATGTTNLFGSSSSGITGTFTTGSVSDNSNAGVWYTSPYNLSKDVDVGTKYVYVIFNERQDPSTTGSSTVAISTNSVAVSGNLNYYDYGTDYVGTPTAVFTPSGNLNYSTTYTITTDGVFDLAGNQIGTNTSTFTTISAPSSGDGGIVYREKLEVVSNYPRNENGNTGTKVYARLSMLINSDDINYVDGVDIGSTDGREDEKFFVLKDSFGNRVLGRTKGHRRSVIFKPNSTLSLGEKYTATVKNTVRAANAAGTQMESDYSWTFTVSNNSKSSDDGMEIN